MAHSTINRYLTNQLSNAKNSFTFSVEVVMRILVSNSIDCNLTLPKIVISWRFRHLHEITIFI